MTRNNGLVLCTRTLIVAALAATTSPTKTFAGDGGPGGLSGIAEREIARRMARMEDARQAIEKGDKLYAEGDYEAALGLYKSAVESIPNAPTTQEWRSMAQARYADACVALARERAKNGRYKEANELLDGALEINPEHKGAKTLKKQLADPDRFPPALTPEHVQKVETVQRALQKANSYIDLGDYDNANREFQDALRSDPYNLSARRGMERLEQHKSEYFDAARDHQRARMLNLVSEAWEDKVPVAAVNIDQGIGLSGVDATTYYVEKMKAIRFPNVTFAGASIEEAVEFLRMKSRDLDESERDPARKGVNIILKAGETPSTAAITLDLKDVPMEEALRYVTELAGMKFKVEPHAVLVVPVTESTTEQYTRVYKVPPDFTSIDGGASAAPAAPADPFAPAGGAAATSTLATRKGAKDILMGQGIPFPDGASAVFNPVTSQLIVKNTAPNLDLVETFVDSLKDKAPKLIYITTKFVEVSQKNTDELGFDWLLGPFNIPGSNRTFGTGGTVGNSANGSLTDQAGAYVDFPFLSPGVGGTPIGSNPISRGMRFGSQAIIPDSIDGLLTATKTVSSVSPGLFALSGVMTDPQFQVVIRALNQRKGVDLMSAPSVTTKSGQRASVEVVREFMYPTEFDPPQIPQQFGGQGGNVNLGGGGGGGSGGSFPVTPTTPTAFEMKPVGVRMEVDPVVGPDGYSIDLNLAPEVNEFEGFINYGSPIQTSSSDALGNPVTLVLTENRIPQPVFSTRKVQTAVTVWDGQTVAMGGLIREDVQDVEDKVPLLGDIPFIGRLFQTKAEDHFKRNLMIFVTAKLIDPSGQPIKQVTAPVVPVDGTGAAGGTLFPAPAGGQ
jgi:general secretion pathway protein D